MLPLRFGGGRYFAKSASEARELLNQAAAKYSGYLDPDTIVAIEYVRADELVYFRLPRLGELESDNSQIVPLLLSYAFGIREGYGSLDAMLQKLRAVVDHIASERKRRITLNTFSRFDYLAIQEATFAALFADNPPAQTFMNEGEKLCLMMIWCSLCSLI